MTDAMARFERMKARNDEAVQRAQYHVFYRFVDLGATNDEARGLLTYRGPHLNRLNALLSPTWQINAAKRELQSILADIRKDWPDFGRVT